MDFIFRLLLLTTIFVFQFSYGESTHNHLNTQKKEPLTNSDKTVKISPEGQKDAGIKTAILKPRSLPTYISAPGEVIPNRDLTAIITPRILAQVIKRLVKVGEHITKNQPVATLSSVEMAKAQAALILMQKEWNRVKTLGTQAVSAKRYQIAEVGYQQAYSRLLAYGMTETQIKEFLKSNDPKKANGEFTLLSSRDGTVFSADFTEGEMIKPGHILYVIVDETSLWVDAKLSSDDPSTFKEGGNAIIKTNHDKLPAHVVQVHHKLDEVTRTRIVRLEVSNTKDQLHPGQFVTCLIQTGITPPLLVVHETSLVEDSDGEFIIYIEPKPNSFEAKEVEVIKKIGPWRAINGVPQNIRLVTEGAFFIHSEAYKNGFNIHNH